MRGKNRSNYSRSTGKGLILNTFLICTHFYMSVSWLYEIYIGSYRLQFLRIISYFPSLRYYVIILQPFYKPHVMAGTCIKEPAIRRDTNSGKSIIMSVIDDILHLEPHRLDPLMLIEDLCGMETVGRYEIEIHYAHVRRESHHASAAVAAHHAARTVRVEISHPEVVLRVVFQKHQTVRTHSVAAVAYIRYPQITQLSILKKRKDAAILRNSSVTVVSDKEVITGTLVFIEFHLSTVLRGA